MVIAVEIIEDLEVPDVMTSSSEIAEGTTVDLLKAKIKQTSPDRKRPFLCNVMTNETFSPTKQTFKKRDM